MEGAIVFEEVRNIRHLSGNALANHAVMMTQGLKLGGGDPCCCPACGLGFQHRAKLKGVFDVVIGPVRYKAALAFAATDQEV